MKNLLRFSLLLIVAASISLSSMGGVAFAALTECGGPCPPPSGGTSGGSSGSGGTSTSGPSLQQDAACKETDLAKCSELVPDPALNADCRSDAAQCNPMTQYVNPLINTLAAVAGIAVVIGIIIGGIQYASSGGDPQKAAAGKQHIKMAVIALVGFFFLYAFLQFLIPGGALKR